MNFFDSIFFFNQIFNPISFTISSIEEKGIDFKSSREYIKEIEKNKTLLNINFQELLSKIVYRNQSQLANDSYYQSIENAIDTAHKNNAGIEEIKLDILGEIVNYAILSIFLIISAMLTFALRNYNDDWRIDMRIYFLVKFLFL
jgi:hypothetical protein